MSNVIQFPGAAKRVAGEHLRRFTIHITRYYPDHEDRHATELYRHTRHQLIVVERIPCWVCGTHEKLETHHYYVEWADQRAVDWDIFMQEYPSIVDWSEYRDDPARFVDCRANMLVLCAKHHRHVNYGIHCLTYPDWQLLCHERPGYIWTPSQAHRTNKLLVPPELKKAA